MAEEYKIESGIPVPSKHKSVWGRLLDKMKPGDSVLIPSEKIGSLQAALNAKNVMITRKVTETHHRVWYMGPRRKGTRIVTAIEPEVLP